MAPTVTMGIDLASQPQNTAVCLLAWPSRGRPQILTLVRGRSDEGSPLSDEWLSATACGLRREHPGEVTKVGIDDPFGWPVPFLDALAGHRRGPNWPLPIEGPTAELRFRETDRMVHDLPFVRRWPLSVSSERIAIPAMRCAAILADIAAHTDAGRSRATAPVSAARSTPTRRCASGPTRARRRSPAPPTSAPRTRRHGSRYWARFSPRSRSTTRPDGLPSWSARTTTSTPCSAPWSAALSSSA